MTFRLEIYSLCNLFTCSILSYVVLDCYWAKLAFVQVLPPTIVCSRFLPRWPMADIHLPRFPAIFQGLGTREAVPSHLIVPALALIYSICH